MSEIEKASQAFTQEMHEVAFAQANKEETYRILRKTAEQLRLGKLHNNQ
mgnify:FL=1